MGLRTHRYVRNKKRRRAVDAPQRPGGGLRGHLPVQLLGADHVRNVERIVWGVREMSSQLLPGD